jgi:hypothetical protein
MLALPSICKPRPFCAGAGRQWSRPVCLDHSGEAAAEFWSITPISPSWLYLVCISIEQFSILHKLLTLVIYYSLPQRVLQAANKHHVFTWLREVPLAFIVSSPWISIHYLQAFDFLRHFTFILNCLLCSVQVKIKNEISIKEQEICTSHRLVCSSLPYIEMCPT